MCHPDLKFAKCPRTFGGYCTCLLGGYKTVNSPCYLEVGKWNRQPKPEKFLTHWQHSNI